MVISIICFLFCVVVSRNSIDTPSKPEIPAELEALGRKLQHKAENGDLYLKLYGQKIHLDINSTGTVNSMVCPPGMTESPDGPFCGMYHIIIIIKIINLWFI